MPQVIWDPESHLDKPNTFSWFMEDGAPVRYCSVEIKVAEFDGFLVDIGRYNELVNGDLFMVYKPTFT